MLTIVNIKLNTEWLFVTPIGALTYLWGVDGRASTFWRRTGGRCRMVTTCPCGPPTPSGVLSQLHPCPLSPAPVGSGAALWSCYWRPVNGVVPASTTRGQLKSRWHAKTYAPRGQSLGRGRCHKLLVYWTDLWRQYTVQPAIDDVVVVAQVAHISNYITSLIDWQAPLRNTTASREWMKKRTHEWTLIMLIYANTTFGRSWRVIVNL